MAVIYFYIVDQEWTTQLYSVVMTETSRVTDSNDDAAASPLLTKLIKCRKRQISGVFVTSTMIVILEGTRICKVVLFRPGGL